MFNTYETDTWAAIRTRGIFEKEIQQAIQGVTIEQQICLSKLHINIMQIKQVLPESE